MLFPTRHRPAVLAAQACALLLLALHAAHTATGVGADGVLFDGWLYHGLMVGAALAIVARGVLVRIDRAAWLVLGIGALAWSAGDLVFTLVLADDAAVALPSVSDALFLAFYPATWIGLGLLVKRHASDFPLSLRIDAIMGALAVSALAATLLHDTVAVELAGDTAAIATTLAYPVGDVLVLALVTALLALTGWRPGLPWALIGAALVLGSLGDAVFLYQSAQGTYAEGSLLDSVWPASLVLLALAAWQRAPGRAEPLLGMRILAMPALFATIAMGVFVAGQFEPLSPIALGLACGTIIALVVRMGVTLAENLRMVEASRGEALTDSLTGLGNRRRLLSDLEDALRHATAARPSALVLFDLDGFKAYNDGRGHVAGDAMLARLGARLASTAAPTGRAYRLGGDEFCVLLSGRSASSSDLHATLAGALGEDDDDLELRASFGSVLLPVEASTVTRALHLADQRMYANKDRGKRSADALRRAMVSVAVGASLLLALPAIAGAAGSAAVTEGQLVYASNAAETNVLSTRELVNHYAVADWFIPSLTLGSACTSHALETHCLKAGVGRIVYTTFDRDDTVTHSLALPASIDGGDGDDRLTGGPEADTLTGGLGADRLDGGPGADTILAGDGDDTISAADGNVDVIDCGTGTDVVDADPADTLIACGPEIVTPPVDEPPVDEPPVDPPDDNASPSDGGGSSAGGGSSDGGSDDGGDSVADVFEELPPALPGAEAPPAPAATTAARGRKAGDDGAKADPAATTVAAVTQEVVKVSGGAATILLACPTTQAGGCRGSAYLDPAPAVRKAGKKPKARMSRRGRYGRSPFVIASGKQGRVTVRLSRSARAALGLGTPGKAKAARRGRRIRAVVTIEQRGRRAQRSVVELRG